MSLRILARTSFIALCLPLGLISCGGGGATSELAEIAARSSESAKGTHFAAAARAQPAAAQNPRIAPIQSKPSGNSYSEWAARWWQWALETPATNHPALGGPCSTGQSDGVWFLGVNFTGGTTELISSCTVPSGTPLFVQLISSAFFSFLSDPPETRTEEFIRAAAECSNFQAQFVRIDGTEITDPGQYLERSILFEAQLPVNNVFGFDETVVPQLRFSPAVDMGFYLFIRPLPVGTHEISWRVSMDCPGLGGTVTQHQAISISVVPRGQ
jgi:hypothetical protein